MAIPPPPPPGPPPPPVPKLNTGSALGSLSGGGGGGDTRNALLMSIQKGAKLKKTVTNDKSGPAIAGRVAGSGPATTSSSSSSSSNGERRAGGPGGGGGGITSNGGVGGGPKLAGIFGGMSEMPKLKPVNRGANQSSSSTLNRSPPRSINTSSSADQQNTSITSSSSSNSSSSNNNISSSNNSNGNIGGALDFNAELTQHLTLKKKKLQQSSTTTTTTSASSGSVTEANLRTNRGPPPQPPPPPKNPPAPPPINGIAANSSSLFGNSNGSAPVNGPVKSQPSVPRQTQVIVKIITMEPQKQNQIQETPTSHHTSSFTDHGGGGSKPHSSSSVSVNNTFVPAMGPKPVVPNKSSLFQNNNTNSRSSSKITPDREEEEEALANASSIGSTPQTPPEDAQIVSGSVSEMKRLLQSQAGGTLKPVSNYGKPYLAPKPPGGSQLMTPGTNVSTPTSPLLSSALHGAVKATVSRHHSMKTPRSTPVAPPGPGGPSQNHFGTMRAPSSQFQSQEAISSSATPPVNGRPIGRPTVAPPPRPPPNKPPPPPLRSVSNQNLPQMPLSTPTTNTLNSAASVNNVSALKEQLKHHIGNGSVTMGGSGGVGGSTPNVEKVTSQATNGNGAAPPLPPHRTCPAPPPPNANRQASNVSTSSSSAGPPVPPQRHSSIRSVSVTDSAPLVVKPINTMNNGGGGGDGGGRLSSINRIIIDLESKFADRFHNPTEFPKPAPFFKTEKHYPSLSRAKNAAAAAEVRKQRAPRPPARQPAPLPPDCDTLGNVDQENNDPARTTASPEQRFIQLTDSKLFANETSNC